MTGKRTGAVALLFTFLASGAVADELPSVSPSLSFSDAIAAPTGILVPPPRPAAPLEFAVPQTAGAETSSLPSYLPSLSRPGEDALMQSYPSEEERLAQILGAPPATVHEVEGTALTLMLFNDPAEPSNNYELKSKLVVGDDLTNSLCVQQSMSAPLDCFKKAALVPIPAVSTLPMRIESDPPEKITKQIEEGGRIRTEIVWFGSGVPRASYEMRVAYDWIVEEKKVCARLIQERPTRFVVDMGCDEMDRDLYVRKFLTGTNLPKKTNGERFVPEI